MLAKVAVCVLCSSMHMRAYALINVPQGYAVTLGRHKEKHTAMHDTTTPANDTLDPREPLSRIVRQSIQCAESQEQVDTGLGIPAEDRARNRQQQFLHDARWCAANAAREVNVAMAGCRNAEALAVLASCPDLVERAGAMHARLLELRNELDELTAAIMDAAGVPPLAIVPLEAALQMIAGAGDGE